jgi:sortase A
MKVVVARQPLRRILRWTQYALFAAAAAMLAYCGLVLVDSWTFQRHAGAQLDRLLREQPAMRGTRVTAQPGSARNSIPAITRGLIGRIEIPRLGLSAMVMEGTTNTVLRRAAGHIAGTALPGQPGNVGIAGHRDTFFRPLRNIRRNDIITLTTLMGEYRYRVVSTRVVGPHDVAVLDPASKKEVLTLVTCYPFYFIGSAPSRFIVRAEIVS